MPQNFLENGKTRDSPLEKKEVGGSILSAFDRLVHEPTKSHFVEDVDKPILDCMQDAWETSLRELKKRGDLPQAETTDELFSAYEENAGLIVTRFKREWVDFFREKRGHANSPNKQRIIAAMRSLDEGTWSEFIEDFGSDLPFKTVEDLDELQKTIASLPEEHREAVVFFAYAWSLQEAGYPLPNEVRQRIHRYRKSTGLPLILRKGRG